MFAFVGGMIPLSGCGSGSGSKQGVAPVATRMRALKNGDYWIYRGTRVTDPPLDPVGVGHADGTIEWVPNPNSNLTAGTSIYVTQDAETGASQYKLTFNTTFDHGRGGLSVSSLFRQDATNGGIHNLTLNELGQLREPVETLPGVWASGTTFERTLTGEDGRTARVRFTVLGKEIVEVPAGRFETWKTSVAYELPPPSHAGGVTRVENMYWFAPQLGQFVQARIVSTRADQRTVTEELRLIQTNTLKP
jgi:hypothetical protein